MAAPCGRTRKPGLNPFARPAAVIVAAAVALSFAVLSASLYPAQALAAASYPKATGNVNDFASVLSSDDKANLDALVDAALKQTGVTFAVAIVKDHGDESLEAYSANLYEKWGIGAKGQDKGLLVVVSMQEHDLRMEVGYGLEPVITDARSGECLDKMLPYFKNNQYGKGLYAGLLLAAQYIAKDAGVTLSVKPATKSYENLQSEPAKAPVGLISALVAIPTLLIAYFVSRGKRCPRCKGRMTVTDRIVQGATYDAGGLAMKIYHCSKCGYHDERPYKTSRLSRPGGGIFPPIGPGPFWGGGFGRGGGGGFSGPRGFGGGRSGGGGAGRKW